MSYFASARETKRIKLPSNPKYWVEVYTDLRWGETKKFAKINEDGTADLEASADAFLAALIKDWNLDGPDGKKADITSETIDQLQKDDALLLIRSAGGKDAQVVNDKGKESDVKKN